MGGVSLRPNHRSDRTVVFQDPLDQFCRHFLLLPAAAGTGVPTGLLRGPVPALSRGRRAGRGETEAVCLCVTVTDSVKSSQVSLDPYNIYQLANFDGNFNFNYNW